MSATIFVPEASSDASLDAQIFLAKTCRIYSQPLFKSMQKVGVEISFHPNEQLPSQFYAECNQDVLLHLAHEQLHAICALIKNNCDLPTRVFYKVESRILYDLVPAIIDAAKNLKQYNSELIIDIHERLILSSNRVADAVVQLSDNGVFSCLGGYEWEHGDMRKPHIASGLYRYVRLANPPRYLNDANRFFDLCFELVDQLGISLIIDKVQSRSQYEYSSKTPCFALKGFYLERPRLLHTKMDELHGSMS